VEGKDQIIGAAEVTQAPNDKEQMVAMVNAMIQNGRAISQELDADAGYFGEPVIREVEEGNIEDSCPPGQWEDDREGGLPRGWPPSRGTLVEKMRRKVRSGEGKTHYRYRKFVVEPVFGQIKQGRGLRQFLSRGFGKVQEEWKLWSPTPYLRKLHWA
jgi:hypothetical protein